MTPEKWMEAARVHRETVLRIHARAEERPSLGIIERDGPAQRLQEAEERFRRVVHGHVRREGEPLD